MIALGAGRFFQNVACSGALLAGKPEKEVRILSRFAYSYGMALFIIDDIIDMLPARVTGKTYASDLEGTEVSALTHHNGAAASESKPKAIAPSFPA